MAGFVSHGGTASLGEPAEGRRARLHRIPRYGPRTAPALCSTDEHESTIARSAVRAGRCWR